MNEQPQSFIETFLKRESASGIILMIAAVVAIVLANSALDSVYAAFLQTPIAIKLGSLEIAKPLLLWINDGLMAVFFFLVGLELKRELIQGELSDKQNIILPAVGAIGGMVLPAVIYLFFNVNDSFARQGWAIPAATDIAFALGVLALLGPRVPIALKLFLTSLAIFDDIGAIIIIAAFYTSEISFSALGVVVLCIAGLALLNKAHVVSKGLYLLLGIIMWVGMLKSGVHATLAGVLLAMFIPLKPRANSTYSPLKAFEHDLHYFVGFFILPVFAFANAGLDLRNVGLEQVYHPVSLGIALGLFLGKQFGIFGLCWLSIKLNIAKLPKDVNWLSFYGTSALCGIGFTMSLFIGSLAFENNGGEVLFDERLGIIIGSLASGIVGYIVLKVGLRQSRQSANKTSN